MRMIFEIVVWPRVDNSLRQSFLDEMAAVYAEMKTVLDERQRRLLLGSVAQRLGRGGIKQDRRGSGGGPGDGLPGRAGRGRGAGC